MAWPGDNVTLACLVEDLGAHKVSWYRPDASARLTSESRFETLHPKALEWLLVIRNVHPKDSGVYACVIDSFPWLTKLTALEVHHHLGTRKHRRRYRQHGERPTETPRRFRRRPKKRRHHYVEQEIDNKEVAVKKGEPYFAEAIPSLTVAAGKNAVLKCVVENLGNYTVAWLNVDKQTLLALHTHVIVQNDRIRVSHSALRVWQLEIRDVRPEDTGYYMCQINTRPMKNQVGYLNVVVAPYFVDAFTTRNMTAQENDNVSFRCEARGNPQPKVTWRREDAQPFRVGDERVTVYRGEVLRFSRVSRGHMGAYLCLASNGVPPSVSRRIFLEVSFPPMIWVPNQVVGAPPGTSVILECHTEAHPTSDNFWVRDSLRLETVSSIPPDGSVVESGKGGRRKKHKKHEVSLSKTGLKVYMKLTLWNLQPEDYGTYHCIAQNGLGRTEGKVQLHEISAPSGRTEPPVEVSSAPSSSSSWNDAVEERSPWSHSKVGLPGEIPRGDGGRAVKHFQEGRFEQGASNYPTTETDSMDGGVPGQLLHGSHRWTLTAAVIVLLMW